MLDKLRMFIVKFIKSNKEHHLVAMIASGLYPILYYYASNFGYANSLNHLFYFIGLFIVIPFLMLFLVNRLFLSVNSLRAYAKYLLSMANIFCFAILMIVVTSGLDTIKVVACTIGAIVLGILIQKHIKKIIVFQFFMAAVAVFWVAPKVYENVSTSTDWMQQPDGIIEAKFTKKPNVYIIQPDGYANFSELKKGNYGIDNSVFENFLTKNNFTLYPDFRSNYFSTLSSNSSMFGMNHHYYNHAKFRNVEPFYSREVIAGNNPVIRTFKTNGYKTHLILESEYLIVNKPDLVYDTSNIEWREISFLSKGFEIKRDVTKDLELAMASHSEGSNFYFIEKIIPGHISPSRFENMGKVREREAYLDNLEKANIWLQEIISIITAKDKDGLIVVIADHGGFVGMNCIYEAKIKQTDPDIVKSVFTSALAIKWPEHNPNTSTFKTSVNLFRNIFAYLSEDASYLNQMQDDASFLAIRKEAPFGIYKAINEAGEVVFEEQ